ncbi:ribosomal-protein-serine acetyltransferase [Bacillus sp. NRRL B-14911]|nr:ribosomal-protein-serine acetyltransferase [Bacillus sp. NRRL B-14911]
MQGRTVYARILSFCHYFKNILPVFVPPDIIGTITKEEWKMNPILIDFPEIIAETERLYIRPCLPGDGKDVYDAVIASKDELKKWLPFAAKEQSLEETEAGIRRSYAQFWLREDIRLHIYRKEDGQFIGSTGLHRIDWEARRFEIGYWCDSRHHKKGYISEAVEALIEFTFSSLSANRIEIRCDPENTASRKIPERLGFTLEATLRKNTLCASGDVLRDTCIFAKLKE